MAAGRWGAGVAIVVGVAVVAAMSEKSSDENPPIGPTILFATISAFGFAGTFALGQYAADISHEMPTTLVTRVLAVGLTVVILLAFKQPFLPGKRDNEKHARRERQPDRLHGKGLDFTADGRQEGVENQASQKNNENAGAERGFLA